MAADPPAPQRTEPPAEHLPPAHERRPHAGNTSSCHLPEDECIARIARALAILLAIPDDAGDDEAE